MAPVLAIGITKGNSNTGFGRSLPQLSAQLSDTHLKENNVSERRGLHTASLGTTKIQKRKVTFDVEPSEHLHKDRYLNYTSGNALEFIASNRNQDQNYKRLRTSVSITNQGAPRAELIIPVDLSDDETVVGDEPANSHGMHVDLRVVPHDQEIQIIQTVNRRPSNTSSTTTEIDKVRTANYTCAPGKFVELADQTFMKISSMHKDNQNVDWVVGQLFARHDHLDGHKWSRRHNEVVLQLTVTRGQAVDLTKRRISEVRRNRCLILTNDSFPGISTHDHPDTWPSRRTNIEQGPLFCRWKQTIVLDEMKRVVEESIEKIHPGEANPKYRVQSTRVRKRWRQGPTVLGGSRSIFTRPSGSGNQMEETQQYTFGDAFCGGGGASCGANEAGLHVKFGVDISENAMKTYKLNFSKLGTRCYTQDIFDFIQGVNYTRRIDVLHISPPCQPFSPAHTIESQRRDETNQAALFAVGALVRTMKPRVVTLEETFGLLNRHQQWFDALIKEFVDTGYSIRWANARLEEYGLPQKRRRLLIIAAGPGEILPPFPAATNSETDDNLPRLKTIHDAISAIPPGASNHDIFAVQYQVGDERTPYSPHTQAKTITCSGGQGNHHPSGKRAYTMRELAALQRFPPSYKFADVGVTELRRQIGNAVPPYSFKKVLRAVIKSLKESDEKEERMQNEKAGSFTRRGS